MVYSVKLDMLNLHIQNVTYEEFKNLFYMLEHLDLHIPEKYGYSEPMKIKLNTSLEQYKYQINIGADDGAIFIGYRHNNAKENKYGYHLKMEFNPRKMNDIQLGLIKLIYRFLENKPTLLKSMDFALDVETTPKNISVISLTGREPALIRGDRYYGQRGSHGRLKVYDKKRQVDEVHGKAIKQLVKQQLQSLVRKHWEDIKERLEGHQRLTNKINKGLEEKELKYLNEKALRIVKKTTKKEIIEAEELTRIEFTWKNKQGDTWHELNPEKEFNVNDLYLITYVDQLTDIKPELKAILYALENNVISYNELTRTNKKYVKEIRENQKKIDFKESLLNAWNNEIKPLLENIIPKIDKIQEFKFKEIDEDERTESELLLDLRYTKEKSILPVKENPYIRQYIEIENTLQDLEKDLKDENISDIEKHSIRKLIFAFNEDIKPIQEKLNRIRKIYEIS